MSVKIAFLDPLGPGKGLFRSHRHFLRDWTGASYPGFIPLLSLDLIYAAAYLRKCGYPDVSVIEASARHLYPEDIVRLLLSSRPDFVVIPSTYFTIEEDKALARRIKGSIPRIKIIFSGPPVTYDPSVVLRDASADFVALGEMELPVVNIVRGNYAQNIAYWQGDKVVSGSRSLIDLDDLPLPARDLVDNQAYRFAIFNRKNPITPMTISRGCPHSKCVFCNSKLYSLGKIRYRGLESICEEIREISGKYRVGEIFFRDLAFTANRELVFKVCDFFISQKNGILWRAQTRVDLVDKAMLDIMRRAGCYQISFGFETCSQKSLDLSGKNITLEQSMRAARLAKGAGLEVVGLFIYGLPGETPENMSGFSGFARRLGVDFVNFNEICVFPGNELYRDRPDGKMTIDPGDRFKKYVRNEYAKFYLRPGMLRKLASRINSFDNLKFLIQAGADELLSHF
ncbi:MAG: radical SAM protein [Candidatus Omnitrophica bacterium]|nr:radical SAM protein [Candidatus Omnitrophota bacterium]